MNLPNAPVIPDTYDRQDTALPPPPSETYFNRGLNIFNLNPDQHMFNAAYKRMRIGSSVFDLGEVELHCHSVLDHVLNLCHSEDCIVAGGPGSVSIDYNVKAHLCLHGHIHRHGQATGWRRCISNNDHRQ